MLLFQPLDQFEITFFYYIRSFAITNASLYLIAGYLIFRFFFDMSFYFPKILPNNWQSFFESFYDFVLTMVQQQMGRKGNAYFPLIFTVFIFVLTFNLLGMTLYSFTVTSHMIVTFTLGIALFIGVVIIGITIQKKKFINTFIPSGAPSYLLPFLVVIEFISYISRPFSLSIRLFANMMSGHALLYILSSFVLKVTHKSLLIVLIPFSLIVIIVGLEFMIAILQAYVFAILICIYINDSLEGAH